MPIVLDPAGRAALTAYSRGEMGALELRRRLDDATFGEVLILLGQEGLPLQRAPIAGRETHLAKAGTWLFGDDDARIKLFVVDTGPLITLAAAGSLDYLLFIDADVVIPDAVLYEATHDAMKLGAEDILDWVKAKRARVEVAPTRAFLIFDAARQSLPSLREPGLGERAAVEVIEEPDRLEGDEKAVLLCEESAVLKRVLVRDTSRIIELSTMDLLHLLETHRKIQSSDATFERAEKAGRRASRVEKMPQYDDGIRAAIEALVRAP